MKKILSLALAIVTCVCALAMASCGGDDLNFGKEYQGLKTQTDVLLKLDTNKIDVGVMDSVMANYYLTTNPTYAKSLMIAEGINLTTEQYGIAARKGSGLIKKINSALIELAGDGTADTLSTLETLADKYGIKNELCIDKNATVTELTDAEKVDWEYIVSQGKFIVGYTIFAPIAYNDDQGNLVGFDIELAKAVAAKLGVQVEFKKIVWNSKEAELSSKKIDCIWNGLTITEERLSAMEISVPYINNKQVIVIRKTDKDKYTSLDSMDDAIVAAEAGSAGEACVKKSKED